MRFIGYDQRDAGNVIPRLRVAVIFRVRDVAIKWDVLRFADAMVSRIDRATDWRFTQTALESDSIDTTVDYGIAFMEIEKNIAGGRRFLIEAPAPGVAQALRRRFPQIGRAEITMRKPDAPVPGVLDHVEVTVAWPQ